MAPTPLRPTRPSHLLAILLAASIALGFAAAAEGQTCLVFQFGMSGDEEVPPVVTAATGTGEVRMDTDANTLDFDIAYVDLSSMETAAHIHGFAAPGAEAPPLFVLPPGNPKTGQFLYTEDQEANLIAGLSYVNIHSSNFPDGEIRGQIDEPLPCGVFADGFESGDTTAWSLCQGCLAGG